MIFKIVGAVGTGRTDFNKKANKIICTKPFLGG